jgi:hypothetical protein
MIQSELLPQALLTLTQRAHPATDCRHMLADAEVDALHEGCVDVPPTWGQEVIDGLQGAKHHAVLHANQPPAAHGLDYLRIQQLGQWHPARLWQGTCGLSP